MALDIVMVSYIGQLLSLSFQFQFVMLGDLKAAAHITSDLQWQPL